MLVWFFRKTTYSASFHPENIQALEDHLRSKHILLFALSEVPAIYGLLYFFLTGHFAGQILLTIFSWICLAVSKPSVPAIEELERKLGL